MEFVNLGAQFDSNPIGVACSNNGSTVCVLDNDTRKVFFSQDAGETFPTFSLLASGGGRLTDIATSGDCSIIYVVSSVTDAIYKSVDGGTTFTINYFSFGGALAVDCSNDGTTVYVVGFNNSTVWRSDDGGETFTQLLPPTSADRAGIACSGEGDIVTYLSFYSSKISKSTNSGNNFYASGATTLNRPRSVCMSDDGEIFYVIADNYDYIHRSFDGGETFTNEGALFSTAPDGVDCNKDGTVVYVVDTASNSLYRSGTPVPESDSLIMYDGKHVSDVKYCNNALEMKDVELQINGVTVWGGSE